MFKIREIPSKVKAIFNPKEQHKPPEGYNVVSRYPTILARNKEGEGTIWISSGKTETGNFVEGFWYMSKLDYTLTTNQISRISAWLKEK